jgi:hypothetical protein
MEQDRAAGVTLGTPKETTMIFNPDEGVIVSSDRLEACEASLEAEFSSLVDHALSRGWSLDEALVAIADLVSKEFSAPKRSITTH